MVTKGIIYYSAGGPPPKVVQAVRDQLLTIGLPIVSATLEPTDFGTNVVVEGKKGYLTMFKQILAALEASTADIIFFCEHDVLYPKEHFDFTPTKEDTFYYNVNWWRVRKDGFAIRWRAEQVSGLCAYRTTAIEYYKNRINGFDPDNFDRKFEPMSYEGSEQWESSVPYVDIRHDNNLTYSKWNINHFRKKDTAVGLSESTIDKIPGWSITREDIYG